MPQGGYRKPPARLVVMTYQHKCRDRLNCINSLPAFSFDEIGAKEKANKKKSAEDHFALCGARGATLKEIEENDYNLNIPRYVDTFEEEEGIDIKAVMAEIKELEAKRTELDAQIEVYLKELGIVE